MLKKSYEYIKNFIMYRQYNKRNDPYFGNYQGCDKYSNQWFVGINDDNKMQLWAVVRKRLIHNAGYYEPYRNISIKNKIMNWKL